VVCAVRLLVPPHPLRARVHHHRITGDSHRCEAADHHEVLAQVHELRRGRSTHPAPRGAGREFPAAPARRGHHHHEPGLRVDRQGSGAERTQAEPARLLRHHRPGRARCRGFDGRAPARPESVPTRCR
jgi:hypothetical protein